MMGRMSQKPGLREYNRKLIVVVSVLTGALLLVMGAWVMHGASGYPDEIRTEDMLNVELTVYRDGSGFWAVREGEPAEVYWNIVGGTELLPDMESDSFVHVTADVRISSSGIAGDNEMALTRLYGCGEVQEEWDFGTEAE